MKTRGRTDIDSYIASYPENVQRRLQEVRVAIASVAPEAAECICYGIPTFKLNGNLVHFGATAKHIGFYPGASGVAAFTAELAAYDCSKGTVRFPLDQELPLDLIRRITQCRKDENLKKKSRLK